MIAFPSHIPQFIKAGWLPPDYQASSILRKDQVLFVWRRLPPPHHAHWDAFWDVPLDSVLTNIVCLKDDNEDSIFHESSLAVSSKFSTLLRWPGVKSHQEQEALLKRFEEKVELLILGVMECGLGLQIIVPLAESEKVRALQESFA